MTNSLKNKQISIIHWNCFKLTSIRVEELSLFLKENQPDILCLNEVKLNNFETNLISFKDYVSIFKTRNDSSFGGGVAILIKEGLNFEISKELDYLNLELLDIILSIGKNDKLRVVSYYNPPKSQLQKVVFEKLQNSKIKFVICGDFNSKSELIGCKKTCRNGKILEDILLETDCVLLNDQNCTFERTNYSEILDLAICCSSIVNSVTKFKVIKDSYLQSDHFPIKFDVQLSVSISKSVQTNSIEKRFNFLKANWPNYKLNLIKLSDPPKNLTIDSLSSYIRNSFLEAAEKSIPYYESKSYLELPKEIVHLIRKKKIARKLARKYKTEQFKKEYNFYTKKVKEAISEFKDNKWNLFLNNLGSNITSTRPFWQKINRLRGSVSQKKIPNLLFNGVSFNEDTEKANLFKDILEETFNKPSSHLFDENFKNKIKNEIEDKINKIKINGFEKITIFELKKTIKKINNNSASGPDLIANKMISEAPDQFLELIVELFNLTLEKSQIPKAWKESVVTMIPKNKTCRTDPLDYRPISLTSCLSKLAEKTIKDRLTHHLVSKNIICPQQSGFRPHRSTHDNLIYLTQKIQESFCKDKKLCLLNFDISKAFDRTWHEGILARLFEIETPSYLLKWIADFLRNRMFCVKVGNQISRSSEIENGVPQGASLSPILFSVFINGIPKPVQNAQKFSLPFADDFSCAFTLKRKTNIEKQINNYLVQLENWLSKWRLEINTQKCSYTIFSKTSPKNKLKLNLNLNKKMIPYNPNPLILGITFDERLTFHKHFSEITKKCYDRLRLVKILSHSSWKLSQKTLIRIYISLIRSIIDYSFFTFISIKSNMLKKLQAIQNKAIRKIFKRDFNSTTAELCNLSNLETIESRWFNLFSRYCYRSLSNKNELFIKLISEYIPNRASVDRKTNKNTLISYFLNTP